MQISAVEGGAKMKCKYKPELSPHKKRISGAIWSLKILK